MGRGAGTGGHKQHPHAAFLLRLTLFSVGYFLAGRLGLVMTRHYGSISTLWPPSGLSLVVLSLGGYRYWPGIVIALGALGWEQGRSPDMIMVSALAHVMEGLVGAALMRPLRIAAPLQVGRVLRLFLATTVACSIGAGLGTLGFVRIGHIGPDKWLGSGVTWFLGDAMGILVLFPLTVAWLSKPQAALGERSPLEISLQILLLIGTCSLASGLVPMPFTVLYLPVPFLVWIAFRHGLRGAALANLTLATSAVLGAWLETGPFATGGEPARYASQITFMGICIATSLIVAATREEQSAAEHKLIASEALYRSLFDRAADGVVIISDQGRFVDVNPAYCRMMGYAREELIGKSTELVIDPRNRQERKRKLHRMFRESEVHFESQDRTKSGDLIPVELRGALVEHSNRRLAIGIVRDISERLAAQEAQVRRERLETFSEHVSQAIDRGHDLKCALEGCAAAIVRNLDAAVARFWVRDAPDGPLALTGEAHRSGDRWSGDRGASPADASLARRVANRARPVLLGAGDDALSPAAQQLGLAYAGFPIQDRKQSIGVMEIFGEVPFTAEIQGALERVAEGIAIGIPRHRAERELQRQREQLQRQHEQAQRLESVGQLAGGIAHDFNNLLLVILGNCELALDSSDPASITRSLRETRAAAERAANLTRQLLAFSRRQRLEVRSLNLNDLLKGLLGMLKRVIPENIEIVFRPDPRLANAELDAGQIEQVVMNLVINARDALSNQSDGRITLSTHSLEVDEIFQREHPWARLGRFCALTVSDTGAGMTEKVAARAFEPFFSTKPPGQGTGLGLSSVYGIVKQHAGLIHCQSLPGQGTTFSLHFPSSEAGATVDKEVESGLAPQGTETVLVAEDNPSVLKMVTNILESSGYSVLQAQDGEEAVQVFGSHREDIDLVILDAVMPRQGGLDARKRIAGMAPRVPCLISSGYSESVFSTTAEDSKTVLLKPYSPSELLRHVRRSIDRSRAEALGTPLNET